MFKWLRRLLRWWRQRRNLKRFAVDQLGNTVHEAPKAPDPGETKKKLAAWKAELREMKKRKNRGAQCETCKGKLRTAAYTYQRWCSKRCRVIARHAGKSENPNRRIPYELTTKGRRIMRLVLNA